MDNTFFNFSEALNRAKTGSKISRKQFNGNCYIMAQFPDENSKMTKPYLYMIKGEDKFPVDLSAESIFAVDWYIAE